MIEKWNETDESMEKWIDEVHNGLETKKYDYNEMLKVYGLALERCSESELEVEYGFKGKINITFSEGCYDISDVRDENIQFIKRFATEELPYLELKETKSMVDPDDVGFKMIFEVKA